MLSTFFAYLFGFLSFIGVLFQIALAAGMPWVIWQWVGVTRGNFRLTCELGQ